MPHTYLLFPEGVRPRIAGIAPSVLHDSLSFSAISYVPRSLMIAGTVIRENSMIITHTIDDIVRSSSRKNATVAAMIMIGNAPAARWTHTWIFGNMPGILRRMIEDPL
jgi:hypothetical protein